jgi:hypothetical protein
VRLLVALVRLAWNEPRRAVDGERQHAQEFVFLAVGLAERVFFVAPVGDVDARARHVTVAALADKDAAVIEEPSHGAVGPHDTELLDEVDVVGRAARARVDDALAIVGVDHAQELGQRARRRAGREPEEPIEVLAR